MDVKRLLKEYTMLKSEKAQLQNDIRNLEITLNKKDGEEILHQWLVTLNAPSDSIFEFDSFYILKMEFPTTYPYDPPLVYFESENIMHPPPKHEHVFANGDICLSTLHEDWTPALGVKGILLSLCAMLGSATEKKSPTDEQRYLRQAKYTRTLSWF